MNELLTDKITDGKFSRKSLYNAEYICDAVREYSKQGMFEIEIRAELGIKKSTWNSWKSAFDKPEFRDALEDGETLCEAFWAKLGREGILHYKTFREATYKLIMTKKYGYGDKITVDDESVTNVKKMSNEELEAILKDGLNKLNTTEES